MSLSLHQCGETIIFFQGLPHRSLIYHNNCSIFSQFTIH